jgi:hypothetical protein
MFFQNSLLPAHFFSPTEPQTLGCLRDRVELIKHHRCKLGGH